MLYSFGRSEAFNVLCCLVSRSLRGNFLQNCIITSLPNEPIFPQHCCLTQEPSSAIHCLPTDAGQLKEECTPSVLLQKAERPRLALQCCLRSDSNSPGSLIPRYKKLRRRDVTLVSMITRRRSQKAGVLLRQVLETPVHYSASRQLVGRQLQAGHS